MKAFLSRIFTDNVKAALLRWWLMGMCYYMIGFGTQAGIGTTPVDLILFLSLGTGLVTVVIFNPIAYNVFEIVRNNEIVNKKYLSKSGVVRAGYNLLEIGLSAITVILVYLTYQNVNVLIGTVAKLPADTVVIPGEPFGFATLYLLFYSAITSLGRRITGLIRKK